jgi:hypothetical protein
MKTVARRLGVKSFRGIGFGTARCAIRLQSIGSAGLFHWENGSAMDARASGFAPLFIAVRRLARWSRPTGRAPLPPLIPTDRGISRSVPRHPTRPAPRHGHDGSSAKWEIRPALGRKNLFPRFFLPKSEPPDRPLPGSILQGNRRRDFLEEYRPDLPFCRTPDTTSKRQGGRCRGPRTGAVAPAAASDLCGTRPGMARTGFPRPACVCPWRMRAGEWTDWKHDTRCFPATATCDLHSRKADGLFRTWIRSH